MSDHERRSARWFHLDIDPDPDDRHMFHAIWEWQGESATKAKLYDETGEAAAWEEVGTVHAKWRRPVLALGPSGLQEWVRAAGQWNVTLPHSDLAALRINLRIEGRALSAYSNQLVKTATEVTLNGTSGRQMVRVRIGLDAFPLPAEIRQQLY